MAYAPYKKWRAEAEAIAVKITRVEANNAALTKHLAAAEAELASLADRVGRNYVVTVGIDSHTPWCRSPDIMVKNRHDPLTDRQLK